MIIIGIDFHPEFQQIASVDTETGEFQEKRLAHREDAETFYRALAGEKVRVGMEVSGLARWFERLLAELQFELWIGDAAEIQSKRVRKQKTDRQDAQLILRLMLKDDFPQIWVPSWENRDLRQLLWHRHRMVQVRTRIMNQLQALALNEGLRCKKRLWREHGRRQLESFRLAPWASRRRRDLLELLDRLNPTIAELSQAIEREADCELSRTGAAGKVQRKSETAGSHHQTREFDGALFAGGGGTGHSAQSSRVAQEVRPAHDAARAQDRQGSDGAETGRCSLLDVAQGMELRAVKKFGSQGRKSGSHAGVPTASTWYPRLRSSRI